MKTLSNYPNLYNLMRLVYKNAGYVIKHFSDIELPFGILWEKLEAQTCKIESKDELVAIATGNKEKVNTIADMYDIQYLVGFIDSLLNKDMIYIFTIQKPK